MSKFKQEKDHISYASDFWGGFEVYRDREHGLAGSFEGKDLIRVTYFGTDGLDLLEQDAEALYHMLGALLFKRPLPVGERDYSGQMTNFVAKKHPQPSK